MQTHIVPVGFVDNSSAGNRNPPTNFDDDVAEVEVEAILHYNE